MASPPNRLARFLLISLLLPGGAAAQVREYDVKAAFLLNFTKIIEWPADAFADASSPFGLCILGQDPFGRALDEVMKGETVAGRNIAIRRISDLPEPQACQIVFTTETGEEAVAGLRRLGPGVLTVADGENFVREGGIIGFVIENRRVRFDINRTAAEAAGLKFSSKLFTVARVVRK